MPVLDGCINAVFEPGAIGASSGTPPVIIRMTSLYPPDEVPVDGVTYSLDFSKSYDSGYLSGVI